MPRIEPLTEAHAAQAGAWLARRHRRLRATEPALDEAYEDPAVAEGLVKSALAIEGAHGVAAVADGVLVGFLIGRPQEGWLFGRGAWVDVEGQASADPAVAADLYAAWARHWVDRGAFAHYVNVPMDELDIWFQLGFGQMHAYALRATTVDDLPADPAIRVRVAEPGDADFIASVANTINLTQAQSPSFTPLTPEDRARAVTDYLHELSDGPDPWWIAVDAGSGQPMGLSMSYDADPAVHTPPGAVYLAATMAAPEHGRRGVGRQLLRHVLASAAERGVSHCVTNWRTSNLLAARSWTALGFRRTHVRLARRIDERVAWARG